MEPTKIQAESAIEPTAPVAVTWLWFSQDGIVYPSSVKRRLQNTKNMVGLCWIIIVLQYTYMTNWLCFRIMASNHNDHNGHPANPCHQKPAPASEMLLPWKCHGDPPIRSAQIRLSALQVPRTSVSLGPAVTAAAIAQTVPQATSLWRNPPWWRNILESPHVKNA